MIGNVFNIQRYCGNDGPGIRTNVFFKGCSMSCIWCHNPESKSINPEIMYNPDKCLSCGACVDACFKGCHSLTEGLHQFNRDMCNYCGACIKVCPGALDLVGKEITAEEVLDVVGKDCIFYGKNGGMTVTGGEPFFQFDFLMELLRGAFKRGIGTCIETNGYTTKERILATVPFVDWYLFDYKETDPELHLRWTGVSNERILENLFLLNECGVKLILRCPIIPGYNDREDHLHAIGELTQRLKCIHRVDVEPYHPLGVSKSANLGIDYALSNLNFPEKSKIDDWLGIIRNHSSCLICLA